MARLRGKALADETLRIFKIRAERYPAGASVPELRDDLRDFGVWIGSDNDESVLRSALNQSQERGTWRMVDEARWYPGDGIAKAGISGRELAVAMHAFVMQAYPGGEFHYEIARLGLEKTGVKVKGLGGPTRSALAAAPDLFEMSPRRGYWRWRKS